MFLYILRSDTGQTVVADIDHQVNKQTISVILQQLISSIELILTSSYEFHIINHNFYLYGCSPNTSHSKLILYKICPYQLKCLSVVFYLYSFQENSLEKGTHQSFPCPSQTLSLQQPSFSLNTLSYDPFHINNLTICTPTISQSVS